MSRVRRSGLALACLLAAAAVGPGPAAGLAALPELPYAFPVEERWAFGLPSAAEAAPVVAGPWVIAADGAGKVHGIDRESGKERWAYDMKDKVAATPAVAQGMAFVVDTKGDLVALELETGKAVATATAGASRAPLAVAAGKLFVGNEAGEMRAFTAQNLDLLWTFKTNAVKPTATYSNTTDAWTCKGTAHAARPIRTMPAVHDGAVVFGSLNHHAYAVDAAGLSGGTTELLWTYAAGDIITASPAVDADEGLVYVASHDGRVVALEVRPEAGPENPCHGSWAEPAWTFPDLDEDALAPIQGAVAANASRVYAATLDGTVLALDAADGTQAWAADVGMPVTTAVRATGGHVAAAAEDGVLRLLHAANGTVARSWPLGGLPKSDLALAGPDTLAVVAPGTLVRWGPEAPPAPDLAVRSLVADGATVTVTVENLGPAAAPPAAIALLVEGKEKATGTTPDIAAGASAEVVLDLELGDGAHVLTVRLDGADDVREEDEANNEKEESAFVAAAQDLLGGAGGNATTNATADANATAGGAGLLGLPPLALYGILGVLVLGVGGGGGFWFWKKRKRSA